MLAGLTTVYPKRYVHISSVGVFFYDLVQVVFKPILQCYFPKAGTIILPSASDSTMTNMAT